MARFPHRGPLAGVALALAPFAAAQPAENWSLRLPFAATTGIAFATHPQTGRPVRFGGSGSSIGTVPYLWEWDGAAWLRHDGAPAPEPRTGMALVADTVHRRLLLFGGNSTQRDTWTWDGVHWQAHATPLLMAIRADAGTACDTQRGRVVLFGGGSSASPLGDTWEWDGAQWLLCQPGAPPAPRYAHRMAFDEARGKVVLFGGRDATAARGDTWEWDGTWWFQRFPAHAPAARQQHALGYDPVRQRIVLNGGGGYVPVLAGFSDTWEWDGTDWAQVATPHAPGLQAGHALSFDSARNRTVMVASRNGLDEVWEYDGTDWTPVALGSAPTPRYMSAMTDDPLRGNVVLFGGSASSTTYGDTWTWDGERWLAKAPVQAPTARSGHALAFDAARGVVVLFGGYTYGSSPTPTVYHDATWTWNGTTWIQQSPATRPSPRLYHGLAWHDATQSLVLFGGSDGSNSFGDTWTWDGTTWTAQQPAAAPPARFHTGMAPFGQHVVLFGGGTRTTVPSQTTSLADTWLWNGATWLPVATTQSPPSRYLHSLVYDRDRNRALVTGGLNSPSTTLMFDDLWAFDGTTWTPVATPTVPGERYNAALAYDPRLHQTVLFGGTRSGYQNDTWILASATAAGTFGSGCPGALGVPAQVPSPDSRPEPGGVVEIDVTNLPNSLAVLAMGFSNTAAGPQPLPMPLAPFGMPGCDLLVAPDATVLLLGNGNTARWSLALPFATGLFGVEFFHQALAHDPTANAAGLTTSAGWRLRIGT